MSCRISLPWQLPTRNGLPPASFVAFALFSGMVLLLTAPLVEINAGRMLHSLPRLAEFISHLLVRPEWQYVPQLLGKMLETIEITFLGTAIALVISLPLGILAAENASPNRTIFFLARNLLSFMRALPEMVWALVFVSAVGLGPLPGVMALSFVTVGFMGKFFAESIEVVGNKAVEGVTAHGAGRLQVIMFAMLPQAMPDFIGTVLYILDHNLRSAAILGLVGAGGIGYDMVMATRLFNYSRLAMIAAAIYVVVTSLDHLSMRLRSKVI